MKVLLNFCNIIAFLGCDSLRGNGRHMVGNGGKFCAPSGYLYECQILDDYWTMMPVTPYTSEY